MAQTIGNNRGYDNPGYKEIQLDATSASTNSTILAELAAHDAIYHSAVGSVAYTTDFAVICVKKNDGTWKVNR